MKRAALILGIIGGVAGIGGALFALIVGGVGSVFEMVDAFTVVGLGLVAIPLSILGIVGGALAMTKPKPAGIMMLIGGIGGIIAISAGYIIAGPLLILAGIIALLEAKKEKKMDIEKIEQTASTKKKKFTWIFWVLGVVVFLIVLTVIGSKTEIKEKGVSTSSTLQKQTEPIIPKRSRNPLVGKWRRGQTIQDGIRNIEFRSDGTSTAEVVLAMSTMLAGVEAKYNLSGDNKIEFEVTNAKCLQYYDIDFYGNQVNREDEPELNVQALVLAQSFLFGMWDYYVSLSGKELTMTNSETMEVIQLVRE
ncbi:MAG: hypothetical protein NC925_01365 [Candidatus Omnitrophica bacterium]|nr:hypothetical protein [Candidatus Omnitrophota bacterium]MCM8826892.1 hypothetical protein [Candidatus Omnitrophota bacterium]